AGFLLGAAQQLLISIVLVFGPGVIEADVMMERTGFQTQRHFHATDLGIRVVRLAGGERTLTGDQVLDLVAIEVERPVPTGITTRKAQLQVLALFRLQIRILITGIVEVEEGRRLEAGAITE